ncbi:hypothetical protein ACH5RR_034905 [Cinchona calisaya]|uniref:adenine phosphoribosyltransferase n=1 Tax=Cinchona calisaya TaxID=153742 RepID=A0ABD2YC98_9GENT
MNTICRPFAPQISRAKIVLKTTNRYFHSGNSVRTTNSLNTTTAKRAQQARTLQSRLAAAAVGERDHLTSSKDDDEPMADDDRIARIASSIRVIPDFPKPGILFQDITTLLLNPKAFKDTIDLFVERYKDKNINVVAGIEARGFIFGPPIALAIGAKFVPMRKPKKLPGEVISEEYSLEYGTDVIEMHVGAVQAGERALVVDDLIATGGTLSAAIRLLERVGVDVVECACLIELPELKGRDRLGDRPLYVLIS